MPATTGPEPESYRWNLRRPRCSSLPSRRRLYDPGECPSAAPRLIARATGPAPAASATFPELTARERDVLALLAHDLDTAAIARRLGLGEKTVYTYIATVLAKLRARDRSEAGAVPVPRGSVGHERRLSGLNACRTDGSTRRRVTPGASV